MQRVTPLCFAILWAGLIGASSGCLSPKHHEWEVTSHDEAVLREAADWPQLPANRYVRVPDDRRDEAVALLQERSCRPIDSTLLNRLVPDPPFVPEKGSQAYLVRGATFSWHPVRTVVRFDEPSGQLLVQQFTHNGEMALPIRWTAEPNAIVVISARPIRRVYVQAVLGGDLQTAAVGAGQQLRLLLVATAPDRADRVDDVSRLEIAPGGDDRIADRAPADASALLVDARATLRVDGAVGARALVEPPVRGRHDGIGVLVCDVARDEA